MSSSNASGKQVPSFPVVMISSKGRRGCHAVNMFKLGVSDYLVKDEATKDLLWNKRGSDPRKSIAEKKWNPSAKNSDRNTRSETLIGQSDSLKKVFTMMEKAVKTNIHHNRSPAKPVPEGSSSQGDSQQRSPEKILCRQHGRRSI